MQTTDPALERLLREATAGALLVLDEHPVSAAHWNGLARSGVRVLTSRYDQWRAARAHGVEAEFSDFAFASPLPGGCRVLYRISKEKAVVHHVINAVRERLDQGGELLIAGYKNEGVRGYIERAAARFGSPQSTDRGPAQLSLARFDCAPGDAPGEPLDDSSYVSLRQIGSSGSLPLYSKPGIYGWNKIDAGSALLLDRLVDRVGALSGDVFDLGCGYGYLSVRAAQLGASRIVATDNCAAALAATRHNLAQLPSLAFDVLPGDAGDEVAGRFATILCNPPFHRGFRADRELTHGFLRGVARHLATEGECWMVVNRFIPVERLAAEHGLATSAVGDSGGFRVLRLTLV